jgi:hypothetical protein
MMGKRGPKQQPAKTKHINFRLRLDLNALVEAAARKRNLSVSREIENRLTRTLDDDRKFQDDERTRALMGLLTSVLRSMGLMKTAANAHWLDDAYAYDQAVIAITTVLAAIRPPGEIGAPADGPTYQGAFNARETLRDVQRAPARVPANASRHRHEMAHLRRDIGDVVDRAIVYGRTADQIRESKRDRLELAELRLRESKAAIDQGPELTFDEAKRLKDLVKRLPIAFTIEDVVEVTVPPTE